MRLIYRESAERRVLTPLKGRPSIVAASLVQGEPGIPAPSATSEETDGLHASLAALMPVPSHF